MQQPCGDMNVPGVTNPKDKVVDIENENINNITCEDLAIKWAQEYEAMFTQKMKENIGLLRQNADLEKELKMCKKKIEKLSSTECIKEKEAEIAGLKCELNKQKMSMNQKENEAKQLKKDRDELKVATTGILQDASDYKLLNVKYVKEKLKLADRISYLDKELNTVSTHRNSLLNELKNAAKKQTESEKVNKKYFLQTAELMTATQNKQTEYENQIETIQNLVQKVKAEKDKSEDALKKEKQKSSGYFNHVGNLSSRNTQLEREISVLTNERNGLQNEQKQFERKLTSYNKTYSENMTAMQSKQMRYECQVETLQNLVKKLTSEKEELESVLQSENQKKSEYLSTIKDLQGRKSEIWSNYNKELDQMKAEKDRLQDGIVRVNAQYTEEKKNLT
jgi:chromosome segregation ATPase